VRDETHDAGFVPPPFVINESHDDAGAYVLTVVGEIDLSTVGELEQVVDRVLAASPTALDFVLTGVEFMDSSGLAILLTASAAVPVLRVVEPAPVVRRVIELSGLASILRMTP
jgi:anti-sigma B factor antagonist